MSRRRLRTRPPLSDRFDAIRAEVGVVEAFPPEALAEAERARPDGGDRLDATDVPFVTIDPPGSRDLDQALHLERRGTGYRVRYAIADLAAFVRPGGALDDARQLREVARTLRPEPSRLTAAGAALIADVARIIRAEKRAA